MFERRDRIAEKARQVAEWQARKEFLRPLPSHEQRLNRLRDWDYLTSRVYEEQQFLMDAERKEAGFRSPVVRFERAFVKRAREYGVPVFCSELGGSCCTILHCQWLDRLSLGEQQIYLRLGLDAGAPAHVRFFGPPGVYRWEVKAGGREGAELSVDDYRERSHDEVNAICDEAAFRADRIRVLREAVDAAQLALVEEMDRLRLSRCR